MCSMKIVPQVVSCQCYCVLRRIALEDCIGDQQHCFLTALTKACTLDASFLSLSGQVTPLETSTPVGCSISTAWATLCGPRPPARNHPCWPTSLGSCSFPQSYASPLPPTMPSTRTQSTGLQCRHQERQLQAPRCLDSARLHKRRWVDNLCYTPCPQQVVKCMFCKRVARHASLGARRAKHLHC